MALGCSVLPKLNQMNVDLYKNYVARIEASVGSELFKHLYVVTDEGETKDVTNNGELSCAVHVSSILTLAGLIDRPHATVNSTLKAMEQVGWVPVAAPLPGAIVLWPQSTDGHEHIGFWLGADAVVSNSNIKRVPVIHGESLIDGRKPVAYYTHAVLGHDS